MMTYQVKWLVLMGVAKGQREGPEKKIQNNIYLKIMF